MRKKVIVTLSHALLIAALAMPIANAAGVEAERVIRPADTTAPEFDRAELVTKGEALWNDPSLAKNGKTTCASCHKNNTRMFKKTFLEAYPHQAKMPKKKAGMESITAEGMVQFCMIVPMKGEPFAWDSEDLAALTAYTEDVVQKDYIEKKAKKKKK